MVFVYYADQFKEYRAVKINDVIVGKVSQFFGKANSNREINSVMASVSENTMYTFTSEHFPMFGLRTLLCIGDAINKHVIQVSNGKVLFKKILNGEVEFTAITSTMITSPLKVSVYVDDTKTKIYIDDVEVKEVVGDMTIPIGEYTAIVGATELDQDYDSNSLISFSVYDKDLYE